MMNIQYSAGYYDALLDVIAWFNKHGFEFLPPRIPVTKKIVTVVLNKFYQHRNKFMQQKSDFEFTYSLEEIGVTKKRIEALRKKWSEKNVKTIANS